MLTLTAPALGAPPPGSALDEYTEAIPGAGGDQSTEDHGTDDEGGGGFDEGGGGLGGGSGNGGTSADNVSPTTSADNVSPTTVESLQDAGADGAAAARLAQATAPSPVSASDPSRVSPADDGTASGEQIPSTASGGASTGDVEDPRGGVGEVLSALGGGSDSSGMGVALPLLLGVALIVAVAIALSRLRSRHKSST